MKQADLKHWSTLFKVIRLGETPSADLLARCTDSAIRETLFDRGGIRKDQLESLLTVVIALNEGETPTAKQLDAASAVVVHLQGVSRARRHRQYDRLVKAGYIRAGAK